VRGVAGVLGEYTRGAEGVFGVVRGAEGVFGVVRGAEGMFGVVRGVVGTVILLELVPVPDVELLSLPPGPFPNPEFLDELDADDGLVPVLDLLEVLVDPEVLGDPDDLPLELAVDERVPVELPELCALPEGLVTVDDDTPI